MKKNGLELGIHDLQRRIALYEDESAYRELFFLLFPSLTRFAAGILQSKENAEEVISDIFIRLWEDRSRLEEIEDLRLYLFIAARNNALRRLKQLQKKSTLSIDDLNVELDSFYPSPASKVLSSETLQRINAAVEALPPRARLVYKLAKEDKLPYKHIAELLNISVKTVDNQLSIALKKIASSLGVQVRKKS